MKNILSAQGKFDRIYLLYYRRLFYFAFNMLHDVDACKDVLEDVFLMLWKRLDEVDECDARSYLFTSVRNKVIDLSRKDERTRVFSAEYVRQAEMFYTDYTDELKKDRLVECMIARLSPPTDQILRMCYLERMKYNEVAQVLGISPNTVKKHISKALRILRELYDGKKDTYLD